MKPGLADRHRVVIVGSGFGGLSAAKKLRHAPVEVTLIDRCNYHLFQPLLYQVATGALSPGNIASPLRTVLKKSEEHPGAAGRSHPHRRRRTPRDSERWRKFRYDTLIVATGFIAINILAMTSGRSFAPGLKTVDDATDMRSRILLAFEAAEREADPAKLSAWMTFVVVGAGPTTRGSWWARSAKSPTTRCSTTSGTSFPRRPASFSWKRPTACFLPIRRRSRRLREKC